MIGPTERRKTSKGNMLDTIFAIAPMMEWTDRVEEQSIISM
jgi:hypothetical protein